MRSTTTYYKQHIASGDTRNWNVIIYMTLADNTNLTLTDADIMQDSFKISTASSGTDTFDIGSAIIGKCQFSLDNWDDSYTQYDFFNATASVWVGLEGDSESHRVGFFTVDEPVYAGSLVQIEMLDNMWKFDKALPSLVLPSTCLGIVQAICLHCGVTLHSQTFHGYDFTINELPDEEMNCREMLQYLAMIGCNFCVMTDQGYLDLRWYDINDFEESLDGGTFSTNTTPYSDGDSADGGNFTNYNSGDDYDGGSFLGTEDVAYFTRLMSRNIGTDIIEITGVKFVIEDTNYIIGQEGYVLVLENPLVTVDNVSAVLNSIWDVLQGFRIRTFNVTALPDIAPEVGDSVAVSYKGTMIYSYLTNYTFTPSLSTASLGAETPNRSLTTRYSREVQAAVQIARNNTNQIISDYDLAVQMMNNLAIHAMGAYQEYEDLATGGRVYYLSNKPITKDAQGHCVFTAGSSVFKATGDGFFVSVDGGQTWINGYNTHTGELVVNVLYTIGLHADWIKTGQLTVGGSTAIYIGTETQDSFRFTPYDSYISEDCALKLYLGYSGAGIESTVTITLHQNGTDTLIGTYTLENGDYGVETAMIDHTVGSTSGDYYLITISGNSPVTIAVGLPQKPKLVVLDAANQPVCTIDERGIIMGSGYISSSDYADTSPVSPYSSTGMKIDVNNKYIKSPYFGFDSNGAHLKGEIEATSGKIGGAVINSNSIKIMGDIDLYTGSGSYKFAPYDFRLAENCDLKMTVPAGGSTCYVTTYLKYRESGQVADSWNNYCGAGESVLMFTVDKTVGSPNNDKYYEVVVTSGSCTISLDDAVLAYMGEGGFKGFLTGSFDGYLDADKGKIAGIPFQSKTFYDDMTVAKTSGYGGNSSEVDIEAGSSSNKPTLTRRYTENGSTVVESVMWDNGSGGGFQNFIDEDVNPPSSAGATGDLMFKGNIGSNPKDLYRYENNQWVKIEFDNRISFTDLDTITPGVTPLETGHIIFVYE